MNLKLQKIGFFIQQNIPLFIGLIVGILLIIGVISGVFGYQNGSSARKLEMTTVAESTLDQEYQRGLLDIEEGNYYIAKQRFEYIYSQDSSYNLALDRWVEIQVIMNSTATPTLMPSTPTVSPTPDGRPKEDLFNLALTYIRNSNWSLALETLSGLRNSDPYYKVTQVDGMIYLALRNHGVFIISQEGRLEEGIYEFSLAEQFGPIDLEAENYRAWARLYLQGNGFWMAYPQTAAYYYGQLVGMVPNLKDTSGMTAFYRYWASLVQYAEQLAKEEDWCAASQGYADANYAAALDASLQATASAVQDICFSLTPSVTPTATQTYTITPTITGTLMTATNTPIPYSTATPTSTATATSTATPTPSSTPTLTHTPTPTGSGTP